MSKNKTKLSNSDLLKIIGNTELKESERNEAVDQILNNNKHSDYTSLARQIVGIYPQAIEIIGEFSETYKI